MNIYFLWIKHCDILEKLFYLSPLDLDKLFLKEDSLVTMTRQLTNITEVRASASCETTVQKCHQIDIVY